MRRLDATGRLLALGLTVAGGSTLIGGCVPQDKYDSLQTAHRSALEDLSLTRSDLDTARGDADALRQSLDRAERDSARLRGSVGGLEANLNELARSNDEALRDIATLNLGPLPAEVERALQNLALDRPDLLTFDAGLGMLRFNSDVTFASGSDSVQAGAQEAIGAIASVLSGRDAGGLVAEVVGHTDNVPIGKPETRRNHPSNLHLSVHRAISVQRALVSAGVAPGRVKVAGYGEYRPVVPNPSRGGAAANRRVEIYITPARPGETTAVSAVANPERATAPVAAPAARDTRPRVPIK